MQVAEDSSGHVSILQKRDAGKFAPISNTVGSGALSSRLRRVSGNACVDHISRLPSPISFPFSGSSTSQCWANTVAVSAGRSKPAPLIRVYRQRLSADDYVIFLDTEFSTWQKTTQVRHRT
jgi:hypothetical protein